MAQGTVGVDERESVDMSKRKQDVNVESDESDDEDAPKRGMKTLTKVVLVAVGWVLLTLFLVGQFAEDPVDESATARLDAVAGESVDLDGDGVIDEVVEEEATDVNGDGIIEIGEGVEEGVATAAGEDGGDGSGGSDGSGASGEGGGGSSGSQSGSFQGTPTESAGVNAVPGAAPPSGGSTSGGTAGSSPTTTASGGSGGGSGGGSSSTTSTTGGSPPTTGGGGGGGATSSTSTTTTTAGQPPPPPPPGNPAIILIIKARGERYVYPTNYGSEFTLPVGSQIRFDNDEPENSTKHTFTIVGGWNSGDMKRNDAPRTSDPPFGPGTYLYSCKFFPAEMNGRFTVS